MTKWTKMNVVMSRGGLFIYECPSCGKRMASNAEKDFYCNCRGDSKVI